MKKGILYIVPTPIGNLDDISFRAIKVLKNVDIIGAEDTRNSGKLLKHFSIETKMMSYHQHNEQKQSDFLINAILKGKNVAIISDAGMPGISDPAEIIVQKAVANDIKVEALPGSTAFLPALVASGLSTELFTFIGFLPNKKSELDNILNKICQLSQTLIFYESPHRLEKTLNTLHNKLGNRKITIAREISKLYESYYRSNLQTLCHNFELITTKGEFVIVVEGYSPIEITDSIIIDKLHQYIENGKSKKDAVKLTSKELNVRKNRVYDLGKGM